MSSSTVGTLAGVLFVVIMIGLVAWAGNTRKHREAMTYTYVEVQKMMEDKNMEQNQAFKEYVRDRLSDGKLLVGEYWEIQERYELAQKENSTRIILEKSND